MALTDIVGGDIQLVPFPVYFNQPGIHQAHDRGSLHTPLLRSLYILVVAFGRLSEMPLQYLYIRLETTGLEFGTIEPIVSPTARAARQRLVRPSSN